MVCLCNLFFFNSSVMLVGTEVTVWYGAINQAEMVIILLLRYVS